MMEYYDTLESNLSNTKMLSKMKAFIKKDSYFFDPYIVIYEIYLEQGKIEEAYQILDDGYQLALERILDKKGNFPDELEWGWLENRRIIRIILNKALLLWEQFNSRESAELFKHLLNSNPRDNVGARFYLLAILEKMSREKYVELFESGEFLSNEVFEWFEKGKKKHS